MCFRFKNKCEAHFVFYYKNESGFPIAEKTKTVRFPLPAGKNEEKTPKF